MGLKARTVLLKDLSTAGNRVLALETPNNIIWNQGIEEDIYEQRNQAGELQFAETQVNMAKPEFTIAMPRMTKELMSLLNAYQLQNGAVSDALYAFSNLLGTGTSRVVAASSSGFYGAGVALDDPSFEISAILNGRSTALTRVDVGTFAAATDTNSFAIAADGAISFSDDIPANTWYSGFGTYASTDADTYAGSYEEFALKITGVMQYRGQREIFDIQYDRVSLNRQENSSIDFSANPVNLALRVLDLSCKPKVTFHNLLTACT